LLAELVKSCKSPETIIVADNDERGREGADKLANVLAVYSRAVRVIAPPDGIKDVRAWLGAGASQAEVERRVAGAEVRRVRLRIGGLINGRSV
jgi:hypothetical protein